MKDSKSTHFTTHTVRKATICTTQHSLEFYDPIEHQIKKDTPKLTPTRTRTIIDTHTDAHTPNRFKTYGQLVHTVARWHGRA